MCDAGIKYQRQKLDDVKDELEWIDVHQTNEAVAEINSDLEFVRERLHVVDEDGTLHVGADAVAVIWGKTQHQKVLSKLIRTPGIRTLSRWLYNAFAKCLYWRNRKQLRW